MALNCFMRWIPQGFEYKVDTRQCEKFLRDLKLEGEGVKAVGTLGVNATKDPRDADAELT